MFNNFRNMIIKSCKDHLGKESATRISGYILTIMICIIVLISCIIDLINGYSAFINNMTYELSMQTIAIFGMLLTQQSILFNLKRKSEETNFPTLENNKNNKNCDNVG